MAELDTPGFRNVKVLFSDTGKEVTLKHCLFNPEFGVNLIFMATLDKNGFSSLFQSIKSYECNGMGVR
jgi:hypothetical protein